MSCVAYARPTILFRLLRDEPSLLAYAAYVDLNPIGAAMAETLEESGFTSVQRRIHAWNEENSGRADCLLGPLSVDCPALRE